MEETAEPDDGTMQSMSAWLGDASMGMSQEEWQQQYNFFGEMERNAVQLAAQQATTAQTLAQWHDHLWRQIALLQRKVENLESWKKNTTDEMTNLRFAHKVLRRQLADGVEEEPSLPVKGKSLPIMLADHVSVTDGGGRTGKQKRLTWAPPSLQMHPPPGLESAKQVRFSDAKSPNAQGSSCSELPSKSSSTFSIPTGDSSVLDEGPHEGVNVVEGKNSDGVSSQIAEWRISNFSIKLKGCMGRALVSSAFKACGLEDLRLMVFPDGKETTKGPRTRRHKDLYAKKVTEGPLEGCLKFKVPECPPPHKVEYFLHVGSVRRGPFNHDFGENTVHGCAEFGVDWLGQVEQDQSLMLKVEIVRLPEA